MADNLPNKILVIDDDPSVPQSLDEPLRRYHVKVDKAVDLDSAMYLYNTQRYEVVMIEIEFDPLPGLALVQKWREHEIVEKRSCAFIMMSGNKSLGNNEGLIKEIGNLDVISKPFSVVHVLSYLSRAMATKRRSAAVQEMRERIDGFYTKTGDFEKAAEQVKKRLADLGPEGLNMLYSLYEKADRLEDALAIITPLSERDPGNISLLNARGRILMRLGRFDEAKQYLEKADGLAPQNIERVNEMANMYVALKDGQKAVGKFKEALELSPENEDLKFDVFSRLFDGGLDDDAVKFGKQHAKPMEIVRHYNNKGVMLSKDNDREGALREYHRAMRFFPQFKENYRILYNIALANIAEKTRPGYEEAVRNLEQCLGLSPDFEKAKKTLQTIKNALNKGKKAS
jgi:tetratricopeptide (TPR) repeat protein